MHPLTLVFCLHNHQPEGNFDAVFEEAVEKAYEPFLDLLQEHPSIKVSLHYSGILLQWMSRHASDILDLIGVLTRRGQVELLTGGFHEPILPVIPDTDKIGQIHKLTAYLRREFGVEPEGMWLAERIWEQHLVKQMSAAGVRFTVLDDTHFLAAGLRAEHLNGYFVTEEEGCAVSLFPISKQLRYLIPFSTVEETMEHLYTAANRSPGGLAVYADDGEKFGIWPRTWKLVWKKEWLRRFFEAVAGNAAWLRTAHFSDVLAGTPPRGKVYLPSASYAEMMQWSLPEAVMSRRYGSLVREMQRRGEFEEHRNFIRGGFWRNFLVKYPEADTMHKKMLRVSARLHAHDAAPANADRAELLRLATDRLWAAQCNCSYWHGVFGGLYLPHIRQAVFSNLLAAENLLDRAEKKETIGVMECDFDCDGRQEVLIEASLLNVYFEPHTGGRAIEIDFKPSAYNILDTLSRREEGYHRDIARAVVHGEGDGDDDGGTKSIHDELRAKEEHLERFLHYDWYRRASFIDHFLHRDTVLQEFADCRYGEEGDFVDRPYQSRTRAESGAVFVLFERNGALWRPAGPHHLRVRKEFSLRADGTDITADYTIENLEAVDADVRFGLEMNFGMQCGDAPDRYLEFPESNPPRRALLGTAGALDAVSVYRAVDEWDNVRATMKFDRPAGLWHFPIETVSLSEDGFERTYQGCSVLSIWEFTLHDVWKLNAKFRLSRHHA